MHRYCSRQWSANILAYELCDLLVILWKVEYFWEKQIIKVWSEPGENALKEYLATNL